MHESEPAGVPVQVSEEQFLAQPETMDRIELIDGEVVVGPSPTLWHQDVLTELSVALVSWVRQHPPARVGLSPLDVRFGPSRIVQPDLSLWLAALISTSTPIGQVPDLVVEVLSSNRVHDRVTKRFIYAEAGVREYWMVDPAARGVECRRGPGLEAGVLVTSELTSPLLPGFSFDVAPLFQGDIG